MIQYENSSYQKEGGLGLASYLRLLASGGVATFAGGWVEEEDIDVSYIVMISLSGRWSGTEASVS